MKQRSTFRFPQVVILTGSLVLSGCAAVPDHGAPQTWQKPTNQEQADRDAAVIREMGAVTVIARFILGLFGRY
jgi:starvation-inducible outer membrane lipoprotein